MPTGTVKRVNRDKGFGFIQDGSGSDYFFHRSSLQRDSVPFDEIVEGAPATFAYEDSPKGPRAGSVVVSRIG